MPDLSPRRHESRRHLLTGGVLALGLGLAVAIYATAVPILENEDLDDMVHSKQYARQVELIGGKATVLATDLTRWFSELWHGRSLAYTVAFLTVVAALVLHLAQRPQQGRR